MQKKYTDTHEWVLHDSVAGEAQVGITEEAQGQLGDIVFVSLPRVGDVLQAGDEAVIVESSKAATAIPSPLSGQVVAVNRQLEQNPSLINQSAEKMGWLFRIAVEDPEEMQDFVSESQYRTFIT